MLNQTDKLKLRLALIFAQAYPESKHSMMNKKWFKHVEMQEPFEVTPPMLVEEEPS